MSQASPLSSRDAMTEPITRGAHMRDINVEGKKPPQRATVASADKFLVGRDEAAQMLSISKRALDYLIASKRLTTRRIAGRVLLPVSELRQYARFDHPER